MVLLNGIGGMGTVCDMAMMVFWECGKSPRILDLRRI